jgi:hypothetical protein
VQRRSGRPSREPTTGSCGDDIRALRKALRVMPFLPVAHLRP